MNWHNMKTKRQVIIIKVKITRKSKIRFECIKQNYIIKIRHYMILKK